MLETIKTFTTNICTVKVFFYMLYFQYTVIQWIHLNFTTFFFNTLKQCVLCERLESHQRDDYFSFGALCLSLSTHTWAHAHAHAPVHICWHTRLGDGTHSWHLFILCSPEILSTERLWTVVFWDGMSCGLVGNDRHFTSTCCLQLEGKIVFTSILETDGARYSETLVSISQTTNQNTTI